MSIRGCEDLLLNVIERRIDFRLVDCIGPDKVLRIHGRKQTPDGRQIPGVLGNETVDEGRGRASLQSTGVLQPMNE